jgi:hypothetical protein
MCQSRFGLYCRGSKTRPALSSTPNIIDVIIIIIMLPIKP